MLPLRSNFQLKTVSIEVNDLIIHVPLMVCIPNDVPLLQSLTYLSFTKRTCIARADVIKNMSQQPITLKCLATFFLSMYMIKFVFKLISDEIASV